MLAIQIRCYTLRVNRFREWRFFIPVWGKRSMIVSNLALYIEWPIANVIIHSGVF